MDTNLKRWLSAAAAVAVLAVSAACSGGGDSLMTSEAEGGNPMPAADAPVAKDGVTFGDNGSSGGSADGVNRTVFEVRSVIRTGQVSLTSEDLDEARAAVDDLLATVDGTVESEQTDHDDEGRTTRSTLVVRVPVDQFDEVMSALEDVGTNKSSSTSSKDVTQEVIDVDERVETLQNSLDRLQSYQAEAKDIEDLLRFEQQITQREAELQSLKAQQSYLADQTAMSTVRITMSTPRAFVEPSERLDDAGFLAGLESGWNALRDAVVVVLTVVGAVLPFGVVLVVLGVPAWLLLRRLVRRSGEPAAAGVTPDPAPPAG